MKIYFFFVLQRDGTFNTKSQLVFQASHYENGIKIHCYAENEVTKHKGEPEGHKVLILEVRCKCPIVSFLLIIKAKSFFMKIHP